MKKIKNNKAKARNTIPHAIIAIITCLLVVAIIHFDKGFFKVEFHEGDIALRDIYSPYDLTIKGEINTAATEKARTEAVQDVLPIYIYDRGSKQAVVKKAESIITSSLALKEKADLTKEERAGKIKEIASNYNISESLVERILNLKDAQDFLNKTGQIIEKFMGQGIIAESELSRLKEQGIRRVQLVDREKNQEEKKNIDNFFLLNNLREGVEKYTASITRSNKERDMLSDFATAILNINIIYDRESTELRRRERASEVPAVYNMMEVKENELILNKGERIGKRHLAILDSIAQREATPLIKIGEILAITLLVGLFILLGSLYIKFYQPRLLLGNKELILLASICIMMLFAAKIIVISPWPSAFIPVAVASMLIALLIDSRLAIIITFILSMLVGMISGNRLDITGMSLAGGMVGVFAMGGVRRRSQLIAGGLCVGFANLSYLIGTGLMRGLDFHTYITESLFGFGNGIFSAVIVTGVLPIFENMFKTITDISLLELADLNHPLLKEMVIKAPGTYHHSLVVGNLAEAACEAIGANPLLARVSSYFHDVGKIEKASYFSENQSEEQSAHDKLSPTMSSLIITNHVKNGVELARKYNLNRRIIDIIREHHGTGLVFYFFKRALEKITTKEVGEQSFRYPGPKPQTREAACVLLADSVEAASRALDEPTPSRIKGLVRKIINNKFIDGQLDECDLTLRDLEKIAEVFTHILTGMYHSRIEYPEEPEKKKS